MKTWWIYSSTVLFLLLAPVTVFGTESVPKEPVVIADFENPADMALWSGVEHRQSDQFTSSGRSGMAFDIPKWDEEGNAEPRPGVCLSFADGKGFLSKDLSNWGAIVIDAWVVGDKPGKMGLKFVDEDGTNSWTTHITVEPGKKNEAKLLISDAKADCDMHHVQSIVLYALRPDSAYTLVVDNLRLLPKEERPQAKLYLQYPNYRNMIFPDGPSVTVCASIDSPPKDLQWHPWTLLLTMETDGRNVKTEQLIKAPRVPVQLPHQALPAGGATVTAQLMDSARKTVQSATWHVRKITRDEAKSFKTYIDADKNLIVDGKPYFPLGWYTNASADYRREVADGPFNTILIYGTNHIPKEKMQADLDAIYASGLKLIYCMNDVYPDANYNIKWEGITGNDKVAAAARDAYKDHPAIIGWYLNDELPIEMAPALEQYYNGFKEDDPNHPCLIVLCHNKDFAHLQQTTDIVGGDTYPVPQDPLTNVSHMVDSMNEATCDTKPAWFVLQAFGWYQYKSENKDRSHIPTQNELDTGRPPTRDEVRCMTYLSLAHGAKGLLYYCYYDLHVLPQYQEMWPWLKEIGEEVKTLSPVWLSSDDLGEAAYKQKDAKIHTRLKKAGGHLYLVAVNVEKKAQTIDFKLRKSVPGTVTVLFENRTIQPKWRGFTDTFAPRAVHVYDLGEAK